MKFKHVFLFILILNSCKPPITPMKAEEIAAAKKNCHDQGYTYIEWKRFPGIIVDITCNIVE